MSDTFSFIMGAFSSIFNALNNFKIIGNFSILELFIFLSVVYMILDFVYFKNVGGK